MNMILGVLVLFVIALGNIPHADSHVSYFKAFPSTRRILLLSNLISQEPTDSSNSDPISFDQSPNTESESSQSEHIYDNGPESLSKVGENENEKNIDSAEPATDDDEIVSPKIDAKLKADEADLSAKADEIVSIEEGDISAEETKIAVEEAKIALNDAKNAIKEAEEADDKDIKISLEDAHIAVEEAKEAVKDAKKAAKEESKIAVEQELKELYDTVFADDSDSENDELMYDENIVLDSEISQMTASIMPSEDLSTDVDNLDAAVSSVNISNTDIETVKDKDMTADIHNTILLDENIKTKNDNYSVDKDISDSATSMTASVMSAEDLSDDLKALEVSADPVHIGKIETDLIIEKAECTDIANASSIAIDDIEPEKEKDENSTVQMPASVISADDLNADIEKLEVSVDPVHIGSLESEVKADEVVEETEPVREGTPAALAPSTTETSSELSAEETTTGVDYNVPTVPVQGLPHLLEKYKGKLVMCRADKYPHCDIILCGSIHVTTSSGVMAEEVIGTMKPKFVMLELCEARVDSIVELPTSQNLTLVQVMQETYRTRSAKTLGMGLLSWMQVKAAKLMGNQLGGEQAAAARVGAKTGAMLVLGDRHYSVTIQRIMDKLSFLGKVKLLLIFLWEILTMTVTKLKDYVKKSEADAAFVQTELKKFSEYMPELSDAVISERDEYMAQTLCEIARVGFGPGPHKEPCVVVAVVGAGHLTGIQKWVKCGGISEQRLFNISTSSKHSSSCWPGRGSLHIVNVESLFGDVTTNKALPMAQNSVK
mmetsp:Transcript_40461/g.41279  ORF Transcript_40461/g.41279 Transcript_40461/m.41279 type:complete len:776 (+) Transcript_40461:178-2505(+)